MKAEYKAYLVTAVIVLAVLYVIANFTEQTVCDNFGITSHKV